MATPVTHTSKVVEWMWKSNADPWSKTQPEKWSHYSDVENMMIEEAYSKDEAIIKFDGYYIDFKAQVQISSGNHHQQRPIKRFVRTHEDKHLREERFMDLPVSVVRPSGGQYGWISPFIVEIRIALKLEKDQLPSKNPELIPMLVERAAVGIAEEGKKLNREREGKKIADMLLEVKHEKYDDVWKRCAYIYSLESYVYKTLNATMRLIGSKPDEQTWQEKIETLGPFCLLLWDDPINKSAIRNKTLYRGAELKPEQIANYQNMIEKKDEFGSFQGFSSCSRSREKAENFGNVLFIMNVNIAFVADISKLSKYPEEEEELITPGVCFQVERVEFDKNKKKYLIYLKLKQRFNGKRKALFGSL